MSKNNTCDIKFGLCKCGKWHIAKAGEYISEIELLLRQIKDLEKSLVSWKDSWYHMRLLVGKCYWEIPYPDDHRTLTKEELRRCNKIISISGKEKDVL